MLDTTYKNICVYFHRRPCPTVSATYNYNNKTEPFQIPKLSPKV